MTPRPHPIFRTRHAICIIATLLLAFTGAATCASTNTTTPQDTSAVRAVELDMNLVDRLGAVSREALPQLDGQDSVLYLLDSKGQPKSVAQLVDDINETPVLAAAVGKQGFTPREYVLATLAIINAYTIVATGGDGTSQGAAAGSNPDHVRFVKTHLDQIRSVLSQ